MKITLEILTELGWKLDGNKWVHERGTYIYVNKMPESLKSLVDIMTGTSFKMGKSNCK